MDKKTILRKIDEIKVIMDTKSGISWAFAIVGWLIRDRMDQLMEELKSK